MNAEEKKMSPADAARRMKENIEMIRADALLMDESDVIQVFRNKVNRLRLELDVTYAEVCRLREMLREMLREKERNEARQRLAAQLEKAKDEMLREALRNETRQRGALLRIWAYPVQPDPIACAHAMQDMQGIAGEAMGLKKHESLRH